MSTASSPYGVFRLGAMQMALHLDALREVVPLGQPMAIPCGNPAILGAVDLRGLLVPVLDLRRQLNQPAIDGPANVVILRQGEHLLGLLADQVSGVFNCPDPQQHAVDATSGHTTLLKGSFPHPENGSLISVLDPARLAALADLPLARAPEAAAAASADSNDTDGSAQTTYALLIQSAGLHMALSSRVVHSTVLNPDVRPSALSGGYCHGVIDVAGTQVAAIDLAAFCGMARDAAPGTRRQAFVVNYAKGLLAFLVDAITDVVPSDSSAALPLPRTALPRPELFLGLLPASALQDREVHDPDAFYLLLDDERLVDLAELVRFASLHTGASRPAALHCASEAGAGSSTPGGSDDTPASTPAGKLLCFDLGGALSATPIEQVSEVVPWSRGTPLFDSAGPALGLMVHRGRAIPTYSLAALLERPAAPATPDASVLVVEHGHEAVGFTVSRLTGIDELHWMPRQDRERFAQPGHAGDKPLSSESWQARALVADAQGERMLTLLNLQQLAQSLLIPGAHAPSAAGPAP